ncbi:MAG: hypothetical protein AAF702_47780 [Chloroflexota bacterium]
MEIRFSQKICVLGERSARNKGLIRQYLSNGRYQRFDDRYLSTIGLKISRKSMMVPSHKLVTLTMLIWDLAEDEEFRQVRRAYFRGAGAAILVCDLNRRDALIQLKNNVAELRRIGPNIPLVFVVYEADLMNHSQCAIDDVKKLARELNAPLNLIGSSMTNDDIDTLFYNLGKRLVAKLHPV